MSRQFYRNRLSIGDLPQMETRPKTTTLLNITEDTYLNQTSPGGDYSGNGQLLINNEECRSLVKFNASSFTSPESATLYMYYLNESGVAGDDFIVSKCTSAWTGSTSWTALSGGTYNSSFDISVTVPAATGQWVTVDLLDIVQDAIDNESGIVSLIMRHNFGTASTFYFYGEDSSINSAYMIVSEAV